MPLGPVTENQLQTHPGHPLAGEGSCGRRVLMVAAYVIDLRAPDPVDTTVTHWWSLPSWARSVSVRVMPLTDAAEYVVVLTDAGGATGTPSRVITAGSTTGVMNGYQYGGVFAPVGVPPEYAEPALGELYQPQDQRAAAAPVLLPLGTSPAVGLQYDQTIGPVAASFEVRSWPVP